MTSQRQRGEDSRRRAEEQFEMKKTVILKVANQEAEVRQADAAKTARLRALRLAKEADDRQAERSAILTPAKPKRTQGAGYRPPESQATG